MVDSYRFGSVRVNGETYDQDLIFHDGRVTLWRRQKGHKVKVVDIESLLTGRPEIVVFGTGAMGFMRVGKKALTALQQAGIEVIAARTAQAIERFNALVAENHNVALAIHLTC